MFSIGGITAKVFYIQKEYIIQNNCIKGFYIGLVIISYAIIITILLYVLYKFNKTDDRP